MQLDLLPLRHQVSAFSFLNFQFYLINFFFKLKAEFWTFHVKFAAIIHRENITTYTLATVVLVFLNVQLEEIENTFVKQKLKEHVSLIKRIVINAERVD